MRFILLCFLFISSRVWAQDGDPYLSQFSGNHYKNSALLWWTTKAGFSCADIKIEHSTDSVNFESIYTWPGICGANTIEINYNYEVPHLKAGIPHFFRLNMGVYGNSSIIKVIIPLTTKTAAIVPHPANWESQLIYQLEPGETADIKLYNNLGTEVYSIQNHPSNSLELKQLNLNKSIYYYTVITSSKLFKGKFIYR